MGSAAVRFDQRFLWRALAASLGLHLLFALLLPIWTPLESSGLQPVESLSFAHLSRAQIERPLRAALPAAVPKTTNVAQHVTLAHTRAEITAKSQNRRSVRRVQSGPSDQRSAAAPKDAKLQKAAPLLAQAPASQAPAAIVNAVQHTPDPAASVDTHSVSSNGVADRGGVMPYGAREDTPVLDPGVRAQLAKLVRTHVTLVVVVDEDGKTKSVTFDPPLDADTENAMRNLLASAAWDPAYCGGGVSCEGTATIKL